MLQTNSCHFVVHFFLLLHSTQAFIGRPFLSLSYVSIHSCLKAQQRHACSVANTAIFAEKVKGFPTNYDLTSNLHLVSLPPVSDNSPKVLRDVWKWKDIVLGDGRDYFVPRPRALRELSDTLVGSSIVISTEEGVHTFNITECAVLSNCARMDVLMVMDRIGSDINKKTIISVEEMNQAAKAIFSVCILKQLESFHKQRKQRGATSSVLLEGLSSVLDLPGMVDTNTGINGKLIVSVISEQNGSLFFLNSGEHETFTVDAPILEFYPLLNGTYDAVNIMKHFSAVAAGIAPRASRPDRPVVFRPFSSRDAHIMLQLKRTAEVAHKYALVKAVLDCALTAGKASRDTKVCPILEELKPYSGEGKYSQESPPQLQKDAIECVTKLAIEPAVEKCVNRLNAMKASNRIVQFQRKVDEMLLKHDKLVSSTDRIQIAKKMMHPILCQLRTGNVDVDISVAVCDIEKYLFEFT